MKNILLVTISHSIMAGQWVPVAAGSLISYCIKDQYIKENFNFLAPEYRSNCLELTEFHDTLKKIDIIGLTCYVWNQDINDSISKKFKEYNPNGLVLYGGPNVPQSFNDAMEYADKKPFVDKFFIGPGEKNFLNFLKGVSLEGTFDRSSFNVSQDRANYQITREETPTPFQDGIFNHILEKEKSIGVGLETTRGCPYSCAFCDWGGQANSKVIKFDEEILKKEISYFLRYKDIHIIDIIDANYGIFERDVDLVQHIVDNKNNLKTISFSGFAKNGSPRAARILDLVHENFNLYANEFKLSFQSTDPNTLTTINRENIKTEKLLNIINHTKNKDFSGELIIGLPGETADSWLNTISDMLNFKINLLRIYRLFVLVNTPMNSTEYIKQNNIRFQYIRVPRSIIINGDPSVSVKDIKAYNDYIIEDSYEEYKVVRNCNSFNDNEFIEIHKITSWYNILISGGFLRDTIISHKLSLKEQYKMFIDNLDNMPFFKSLHDHYVESIRRTICNEHSDTTTITSFDDYSCFMTTSRDGENLKIYKNLSTAISEIKQIYPDATFDHIDMNIKNLNKLSTFLGKLTK